MSKIYFFWFIGSKHITQESSAFSRSVSTDCIGPKRCVEKENLIYRDKALERSSPAFNSNSNTKKTIFDDSYSAINIKTLKEVGNFGASFKKCTEAFVNKGSFLNNLIV